MQRVPLLHSSLKSTISRMFRAELRLTESASGWSMPGRTRLAGPWPAQPPTPHFCRKPWPSPQNPHICLAPSPHLYGRALASLAPNPPLLSTGSWPAWPTTSYFYWPDPSLLLAKPSLLLTKPSLLLARLLDLPLNLYWPEPSLLLARPLASVGQIPHLY